jgi:hypothetical protein
MTGMDDVETAVTHDHGSPFGLSGPNGGEKFREVDDLAAIRHESPIRHLSA